MTRLTALVAAVLVTSTACTVTSQNRPLATVGGVALTAAGVLIATPDAVDSDHDGVNDWVGNDDWSGFVPGTLMMIAGVGLLVAALTAPDAPDSAPSPRAPAFLTPATTFAPEPAELTTPGLGMRAPAALPPAALPELPATAEVLRVAKQVRAASSQGRCDAAWTMWRELDARDSAYAAALREGPVMARCTQPAQALATQAAVSAGPLQ